MTSCKVERGRHLHVISCENSFYHAWQAKVAVYSCLQHQGVAPVVMVHEAGKIDEGFRECARAGAGVFVVPNRRGEGARDWAARNMCASLLDAVPLAEAMGATHMVMLDPDMVWTRKVNWPLCLAVDRCRNDLTSGLPARVAADLGIELGEDPSNRLGSRVPYVIPTEFAEVIGLTWWEVMAEFEARPGRHWSDQMRAWCIALAALDLDPLTVELSQTNHHGAEVVRAPLLHYAYHHRAWDKKWFMDPADQAKLWNPPRIPARFVQGWVHQEVIQAHAFYAELAREPACT